MYSCLTTVWKVRAKVRPYLDHVPYIPVLLE